MGAQSLEDLCITKEEEKNMGNIVILCGEYIDEYRRLYGIHLA